MRQRPKRGNMIPNMVVSICSSQKKHPKASQNILHNHKTSQNTVQMTKPSHFLSVSPKNLPKNEKTNPIPFHRLPTSNLFCFSSPSGGRLGLLGLGFRRLLGLLVLAAGLDLQPPLLVALVVDGSSSWGWRFV